MIMVRVVASIRVKTGKLSDYLAVLKDNLQAVRREQGCVEYVPAVDMEANLPPQILDRNVVTILEKWESLEALHAHLGTPHMRDHREKVKDMVESVSFKVLREAL